MTLDFQKPETGRGIKFDVHYKYSLAQAKREMQKSLFFPQPIFKFSRWREKSNLPKKKGKGRGSICVIAVVFLYL